MFPHDNSIRQSAVHIALRTSAVALAAMALSAPSDRRMGLPEPHELRRALQSGPILAPVKRRRLSRPPSRKRWSPPVTSCHPLWPLACRPCRHAKTQH